MSSALSGASTRQTLLVVEDDAGLAAQLSWCFDDYDTIFAGNRADAIAELRRREPPVVLQDLGLPPDAEGVEEGLATLRETLALAPHTKVIVVTGNDDRHNAIRAVRLGAHDFYQKPVDVDVLRLIVARAFNMARLEREVAQLRISLDRSPFDGVIAADPAMLQVCRNIEKVAPANVAVLILGESGTGKELLARAVHRLSPRAARRFQALNCAAIPEQLLEAELFGYEKGAFTGAIRQTPGKIELANGGTVFLDEIGDMPLAVQVKMLRFLQEKVVERVGGRVEIPVDVRIVAATNQDLQQLIVEGRFRRDLYYRLSEVSVLVPPLRARPGDAAAIAHALLRRFSADLPRPKRGFTDDALTAIAEYGWPGNVRELENKVKSAVLLGEEPFVTAADLGLRAPAGEHPLNLREVRARADRQAITRALQLADGNMSKAAEILGITRPTLYDLLQRLGIEGLG